MGAVLPSWGQLLDKLCESAGITTEKKAMLQTMNYLDYAQVLKEDLHQKGLDINTEIAKLINSPTYALTHALLATWRVANTVTQNYDDMYEKASADSSASHLAVIPYKFDSGSERWLHKMHGCVNNSADIVLTREDYQNYNVHREALSGVVQTLMMTKHMLILGFSMTDEQFIDLAFTLRKAVGGMERDSTLGTVVMLKPDPIRTQLWNNVLSFFAAFADEKASFSDAARDLEIFLDYVGAFSHSAMEILFNGTMDPLLDTQSIALRDGLHKLIKETVGVAGAGNSPIVEDFIATLKKRYGYTGDGKA